jgi:hypothetical protein
MTPFDLSLMEILDHLSRRAAKLGVPAPRRTDRVGDWCALGEEEENHLRKYLRDEFPGWEKRFDESIYGDSFEQLIHHVMPRP